MSHKSLTALLNSIGKDHDSQVIEWRDAFLPLLEECSPVTVKDIPKAAVAVVRSEEVEESECDEEEVEDFTDIDIEEFMNSASESEDSDPEVSSEDEVMECDSDSDSMSVDASEDDNQEPEVCVAAPPKVLEPYYHIQRIQRATCMAWPRGYRICGDNIDKTVNPRYIRFSNKAKSLHYFHFYGIQNRVNVSGLSDCMSDEKKKCTPEHIAETIVPSKEDDGNLRDNVVTLLSRVLVTHLNFFNFSFDKVVDWHINHQFSEEMSQKSNVVPLGIILKNENKSGDMVDIMEKIHEYVPSVSTSSEYTISSGEEVKEEKASVHPIVVGGDQLTAARMRSAIKSKMNGQTHSQTLSGIVPAAEDWHTKANFLGLIFRYLYSTTSAGDHGSLHQLRNSLGRKGVGKKPLDNFNACDDFFVLVVKAHIISAAMEMLEMSDVTSIPSEKYVPDPENVWMLSDEERKGILTKICQDLFDKYIDIQFHQAPAAENETDKVNVYARRVLSLGCFYLEYSDGIREGDGDRVTRCWRYLMPMFVASGRKNYALESLHYLLQHDFTLPPRQAAELVWSRFVNVRGQRGANIPLDLHMEHLNRLVKNAISGLGANKVENGITRVGKVLHVTASLLDNFDVNNGVVKESGRHGKPSEKKDLGILLKDLLPVFKVVPYRVHPSCPNPCHPLYSKSHKDIQSWIVNHLKKSWIVNHLKKN